MKTLDYLHLNENKVNSVVSALHQLLADFQVHYTNLRGFHWDIKGHGFFVLHSKFEDMYNDAAEKVDEIAERILMLGDFIHFLCGIVVHIFKFAVQHEEPVSFNIPMETAQIGIMYLKVCQ